MKAGQVRRARSHRGGGRADAQPEGRLLPRPDRRDHRRHGPIGLGEVVARVRHALRGGPATLRRVDVDVRASVPRADGAARRRPDRHTCCRRSPSSRSRPRARPARRWGRRRRSTTSCASSSPRRGPSSAPLPRRSVASRRESVARPPRRVRRRARVSRPRPAEGVSRGGRGLEKAGPLSVCLPFGAVLEISARGRDGSVVSFDAEHASPGGGPSREARRRAARPACGRPGAGRVIEGVLRRGGGASSSASLFGPPAFLRGLACNSCGRVFEEPTPAHFSFNSPRGACRTCQGFGRVAGLDAAKMLPDARHTLLERPFAPFNTPGLRERLPRPRPRLPAARLRRDVPWNELTARERELVWNGDGDWYGVEGALRVPRDEALQGARPRDDREVPRLRALPGVPRGAAPPEARA